MHNVLDGTSKARTATKISTRKANAGEPIAIDVQVTSATGKPVGYVEVFVDGQWRGQLAVGADGTASLTIAPLMPGEHKLSAFYQGSTDHLGSGSDVVLRVR